ncbi:tetratricopeptide repeat protein [Pseudoalteromonas spongiae]|uniref:tetratricopeptide repeat protein n=1 Tax=Pseudoalteromonas spongiae TaxID=298657 RepID=UPI00026CB7BF|nr:tetratricopeptide repeat protein [Pseudoalteromonas spongiae]ATD00692.1 hypothetical protein PSPO_b0721 [Pseudoalteromonas spongiae UST010723-006]
MKITLFLTLLFICTSAASSSAHVDIAITKPSWDFEIKYGLLSQDAAKLTANEQTIATTIKPLLAKSDYNGAWQAVKHLEINTLSPALAQAVGQIALQVKQLAHAERAFRHALSKRPDLLPSHRALAAIYLKLEDNQKAAKYLASALTLGDQDASLFAQLAYLHMQQAQPYAAIAGFRQALFLQPDSLDYKKGLLWALTQAGDVNEATVLLNQLIENTPNEADLWLHLSQIQLQQGKEKNALASIEVARRLGNNNPTNLLLIAQLHLNHGSSDAAVKLLTEIINKDDPAHLTQIVNALTVLINQNNVSQAQVLASVLEKHSTKLNFKHQSMLLTYLALLAERNGKTKTAEQYLTRAIETDASNGKALLQLGQLYQHKKQLSQANNYYVRASSLDNYKEQAWLFSAQIAIDQGQYERAITLLNNAYRENPTRRDLLANIKQLERLKRVQ